MPYLNCQVCRLVVYSAAGHSTRDECPRCDAPLGERPRSLFARQPDLTQAGRGFGAHQPLSTLPETREPGSAGLRSRPAA